MLRRSLVPIFAVLLSLTLWSAVHAQSNIPTLQQAISGGQASIKFSGNGGSSGDVAMAEVSKGPKAPAGPQTVTVPPGSVLTSSEASAQSLVLLGVAGLVTGPGRYRPSDNIVIPASGTATYILKAFCAEFHKNNPSNNTHFTLHPPDSTLGCIVRESRKAGLSIAATQAAVWMQTDGLTYDEMAKKFRISRPDWDRARQAAAGCGVKPH